MKIAIAQLNPTIGDITNNAQQIIAAAKDAAKQNVRLLLTPELSLCGYPPRDLLLYPGFVETMSHELKAIASQLPENIAVLIGTVETNPHATSKGQKPLYNSMALLDGGEVKQIFHKRLLPTYDVFDEDRYFEPGYEANYFTLDGVKVGVSICEDLWNDEQFWGKRNYEVNPIEELVQLGVDVITNLSASPYTVGKNKLRSQMLNHAATAYSKPIIYVNQIGGNDDLVFDGNSMAFSSAGGLVTHAKSFAADLVVVELDELKETGEQESRGEIDSNEEIYNALVLGVKDYARKCGFSKATLGLSGGIDSALVAAVAASALGAENVLGVLMPSPYSSHHSVSDAVDLVNSLGIKSQQLAIKDAMTAYDKILDPMFAGTEFGIAEENIQSRIRGNLLMAIANKFGYLLLSTGNKSEMAVGYCTLYGDMNGGLAVIADVPKTRVFELCRWLNKNKDQEIIPVNIITKPPSAELKPDQKDSDSLPDYEILDDILDRIICQHQSLKEVIKAGHDTETVAKVMKLLTRAEFKRRQAPPAIKITDRAFGTGWRMPIASRWSI